MASPPRASLSTSLTWSTHYFGDNPDRVVLGKWAGQEGGYIGEARADGGIFFDTGDPAWKALAEALDKSTEQAVVWAVNENFLRTQMENQVGRIDYVLTPANTRRGGYDAGHVGSYSAKEVKFLRRTRRLMATNESAIHGSTWEVADDDIGVFR